MTGSGSPLPDADVAHVLRVQRAAYLIEARLLGDTRIPPLHETEADLRAAGLSWILERDERGTVVGAIGYRVDDGEADIDRVMVDPTWQRRGIGARLVRGVLSVVHRAVVSTGRENAPARRLYEGLGFAHLIDREVVPGLWVSDYEWDARAENTGSRENTMSPDAAAPAVPPVRARMPTLKKEEAIVVEPCSLDIVAHDALTGGDLDQLRLLFDREYLETFGPWDPEQPYGYAGHDTHVIARTNDGGIVAHVGWAHRVIGVGQSRVSIAGVGGVLVSPGAREGGLGRTLMARAAESMADDGRIAFGYLGCREEVVPFYLSCGWQRIAATEHSVSRTGMPVTVEPGPPLLVLPVGADRAWPTGSIDLRGRAW
ncbi:GNAT family N-acetyltransferase [Microbacterium testaceum]|nr:GNAT family N-acetyltransferase [Microbacterium testaceum]